MPLELPQGAKAPGRVRDLPTWLISRSYTRSNALLNEGFAATGTGLRPYHYRLMASIDDEGPIGQAELGRVSGIDRSDVANMLADLEQRGLVERTVDPTNRRRNIVAITQAGSNQLTALGDVLDEIQEQVLAPLSPNERRQLTNVLRKLLDVPPTRPQHP
jgi:MarR family transcriptional regulator, lower aerobic nicotinate degradation pathway regulator